MNMLKNTISRIIVMKTRTLCGIILATFILPGCGEDFLYKEPKGVVFTENLATREGLQYLTVGMYACVPGTATTQSFWDMYTGGVKNIMIDMMGDNAYKGSIPSDGYELGLFEYFQGSPDYIFPNAKWLISYDGISRCNDLLKAVATCRERGTVDEETALLAEAQAKFLRGWWHFRLLKIFWQIPYITEDVIPEQVPNDHQVWSEIEADIQFGIDHLPASWPGEPGKATRWAALAYKAYVYLYQKKYAEAKVLLDEIINSNRFRLVDNYHDNFDAWTENNAESIFEVQYVVNYTGAGTNSYLGNADSWNANASNSLLPVCCGAYQASQDLVNAFKVDANGLPLLGINGPKFNDEDLENDMGLLSSVEFHPTEKPLDPRLDWTVGRRGIPFHDWGIMTGFDFIREQSHGGPYLSKKFMYYKKDQGVVSHSAYARSHSINWRKVRYGHVLLWRAECAVEENDLEKARDLVNMIRRRAATSEVVMGKCLEYTFSIAGWQSIEVDYSQPAANYLVGEYPSFPTQEYAREAVRMEHRLEFGMEGNRFYDLVRWGIDYEVMTKFIQNDQRYGRTFMKDAVYTPVKNSKYPIPQRQLDMQVGVLEQDPLWK